MNTRKAEDTNKTKSNKNNIPMLIRSDEWTITEKAEDHVAAVCLRNKLDERFIRQSSLIQTMNNTIEQQNRIIEQQNKKIESLNNQVQILLRTGTATDNKTVNKKNVNRTAKKDIGVPSTSVQRRPMLMSDSCYDSNGSVLGSQVRRDSIVAVYTQNTLKNVPASAWDVSAAKNGSVKAWIAESYDPENSQKKNHLFLAADGDIYANPDCSYLFAYYTNLTDTDLSHLKTDLVTSMYGMFVNCSSLTHLDVSGWNTSKVTSMKSMFYECKTLNKLDVSNWDTRNVTDMYAMFYACESLETLDVSNWNTSHVTCAEHIFNKCQSLKVLDVSGWNTDNVTSFNCMFYLCRSLTSLDVSRWNTKKVNNMYFTFGECSNLRRLDTHTWNTSSVTTMQAMFSSCTNLNQLMVSQWDVSKVTNMDQMFFNCLTINRMNKGALSSWKLNPAVTMKNICDGTKYEKNPMYLFQ